MLDKPQIKEYLDTLNEKYNQKEFITDDPISLPHRYTLQEDIEIAGFLASTIAWGKRAMIVRNANRLMVDLMGDAPLDYVLNASHADLKELENFVHRTFNNEDLIYFIKSLRNFYQNKGGLGGYFQENYKRTEDLREVLAVFYDDFFALGAEPRTKRHLSSIAKGSACKRLLLFLKWMVRNDKQGVDLGIWSEAIPSSALYIPLDVHVGNVSRELGLITRNQNDFKAVEELTTHLREFDPQDPVKYDFALFCAGINKDLKEL